MKKLLVMIICVVGLLLAAAAPAAAFSVDAAAAILIDAGTGRILYEQNAHEACSVASTTKVLTALLTLENISDLDATIAAPPTFDNVGESSINILPNETFTYRDLLYALMLRSANDAAQLLAYGVAGSESGFVEMMNEWTSDHGLTDSQWNNPHGLDTPSNMVSAYDLAMIAKAALEYPLFDQIVNCESYTIYRSSSEGDTTVTNHNQFLKRYTYADGIKTGYTSLAGSCLVGSATKNGLRLIGVVLGGHVVDSTEGSDYYTEMANLMDYGFEQCTARTMGRLGDVVTELRVNGGNVRQVRIVLGDTVCFSQPKGAETAISVEYDLPDSLDAPLTSGQQIGTVSYFDENGTEIKVGLLVNEDVEVYNFRLVWEKVWQKFANIFMAKSL